MYTIQQTTPATPSAWDFAELKNKTLADLIGIPYKDNGRSFKGVDCYGLAIAAEYIINGRLLKDVVYDNHAAELCEKYAPTLNIKETAEKKAGNLIEMTFKEELHVGVIVNENEFIHATINQGVRISHLRNAPIKKIYEVI